jgi:hypothetical protein
VAIVIKIAAVAAAEVSTGAASRTTAGTATEYSSAPTTAGFSSGTAISSGATTATPSVGVHPAVAAETTSTAIRKAQQAAHMWTVKGIATVGSIAVEGTVFDRQLGHATRSFPEVNCPASAEAPASSTTTVAAFDVEPLHINIL